VTTTVPTSPLASSGLTIGQEMHRLAALIALVVFPLAAAASARPSEGVQGLVARVQANGQIRVVALDGSSKTVSGRVPGRLVRELAFSPRGDRIATVSSDTLTGPASIYIASIDGAVNPLVIELGVRAHHLTWARDGSRVAVVVGGPVGAALDCHTRTGEAAVLLVDTSTGRITRLPVTLPRRLKPSEAQPVWLSNWGFSPDGSQVLIEAYGYGPGDCGNSLAGVGGALMAVQTDGTGQHEIGGEGNRDTSSAVWDPTGTFVGIVDNRCDAPCTFEVIRVATGGRRLVTSRRGLDQLVWIGGGRGLVTIDRGSLSLRPGTARERVSLLTLNGRTRSLAALPRGDDIGPTTASDDRHLLAYLVTSAHGDRVEVLDLESEGRRSFELSSKGWSDVWVGTDH
jgi:hypothetical protein